MGSTFIADTKRILADRAPQSLDDPAAVPAAVLLTLYPSESGLSVVLQKRSELVEHHKGEISFPGGMADPADGSRLQTALREAQEEMGIAPEDVDILGRLDDTPTQTGFMITTYVGVIPYPYRFTPAEVEVAEVIEAPIAHLRTPEAFRVETRLRDGRQVTMPTFVYDGHIVFGATARILDQFLSLTRDVRL